LSVCLTSFSLGHGRNSSSNYNAKVKSEVFLKLVAYDVDEMNVLLYDKTAVVTGRVTTKRMVKGAEVVSKSRFTDVFVWRQERWQLVAGHSSRIRQ